jgi:hypothetical protein
MVEKCMFIVCTIRLHARNKKNVENARPAADGGGRLEERMWKHIDTLQREK